jgi:hypothetical protein
VVRSESEQVQKTGQQPAPAQTEGPDEEAGEGLEQKPAPDAAGVPASQGANPGQCKKDKGGIVH